VQLQLGNTQAALQAYQQDKLQKPALAQSFYQQALAIAEVLAKKDTANAQAQQDLKVLRSLVEEYN
jgi:hypothetical protein